MKTSFDHQPSVFFVLGQTLYIRWNIQQVAVPRIDGATVTQWVADEAVANVADARSALIEKIIGSQYSVGAEIATINNAQTKPQEYADYQAFRVQTKALADQWLAQRGAS